MNAVGTGTASISSPCILTIRQQGSPAHLLGRVQATSRFMTWSLMPVSALFAGWLAEVYGTTVPILTGGLLVLSASFFIFILPWIREGGSEGINGTGV